MTITLAQISAVATTIIAVALCVLTIVAVVAAWQLRQYWRLIDPLLARLNADLPAITRSAHAVTENVNFVTTAIREDIQRVSATISVANTRVEEALAMTERRVQEFNALLTVAQEEAEDLFVSTASTVRGVRHGAEAFRRRSGTEFASDEPDEAGPANDTAIEEEGDGDDDRSEPTTQALPAAPRIKPRPGHRRRA